MAQHALVTGPIEGRIPHRDGFVNVTDPVLYFDTQDEARAVADSIEAEHAVRGSHPVQQECAVLNEHRDEFPEAAIKAHQDAHKALNKKAGL